MSTQIWQYGPHSLAWARASPVAPRTAMPKTVAPRITTRKFRNGIT
ncbi:hypothetical protein [Methylobacterium aquaticum]|nr:hypothetical protein [Methylobacterium aquaticum]